MLLYILVQGYAAFRSISWYSKATIGTSLDRQHSLHIYEYVCLKYHVLSVV